MSTTVTLVLLAGCGNREAVRFCNTFEDRYAECVPDLPGGGAVRSMRTYCRVSMAYEPAPDDHPDNLAALTKAMLERCAAEPDCGSFLDCLEENRCSWLLTGPDDRTPQFTCSPR